MPLPVLAVFFLLIVISLPYAEESRGSIVLKIHGFRNNKGKARILLFSADEKEYFPSEHKKAYKAHIIPVENQEATFAFRDIPYGSYAISVHHDENDNGRIDSNLFKIPREGLGASNDAKGSFGPPSYDKAEIKLNNETLEVEINMVYP